MSFSLPGRPARRGPARPRRLLTVLTVGLVLMIAACAWLPERRTTERPPEPAEEAEPATGEPGQEQFYAALGAVDRGDFEEASEKLRYLAARCESGVWGQEALLVLASVELSPRNPDGSARTAARLLARYLQVPSAPTGSVMMAETLYLLAVDLGADPVTDPFAPYTGNTEMAFRFDSCEESAEGVPIRPLPRHPGPATTRESLRDATRQRDSLANLADSLSSRMATLEAELERIRRLLLPDTVRSGRDGLPRP